MQNTEKLSLEQIRAFLEVSGEIEFEGAQRREVYHWVTHTLGRHEYGKHNRVVKRILRRYVAKMTGLAGRK